ncbi:hypothetical protein K2X05_14095 [bacterium]|nr:hypothetical protein [bacterium]
MRFIFLLAVVHFSINGFACEEQLISELANARKEVVKNFKANSPCYNAAMIGRTKGAPGCFPPEAFQLRDLLTPILANAKSICKKSCRAEGKMNSCLAFIQNNNLKAYGIDNLVNQLKNQGLTADDDFEDPDFSFETIEI